MPVEVDWSKNDTSLIGRFWDAHPGQQAEAAEISDRILVFHRGIDTVSGSGSRLSWASASTVCHLNRLSGCMYQIPGRQTGVYKTQTPLLRERMQLAALGR